MIVNHKRIYFIFLTLFYYLIFKISYKYIISPNWNYFGLDYTGVPLWVDFCSLVLIAVPSFIFPLNFSRPSVIFCYIKYSLLYIPLFVILPNTCIPVLRIEDCLLVYVSAFIGMNIFILFQKLPLINLKKYRFNSLSLFNFLYYFIFVLIIISFCFLSVTILKNILTNNSLISFVFEGHQKMRKVYGGFSSNYSFGFLTYFTLWFGAFFLPVRFAISFFTGYKVYSIIILIIYLFLFLLTGYKSYIVFFLYMPFLAYLLISRGCFIIKLNFIFTLVFLLSSFMVFLNFDLFNWILLRIYCITPLVLAQFYDFFSHFPYTFLSHVSGINYFIAYPFNYDLGVEIGLYHYGGGINVNGGLWASDGIAAFGLIGIIISSIIASSFFYIIDSLSKEVDTRLVVLMLGFLPFSFLNISFFTTILSSGLFLFVLFLFSLPRKLVRRFTLRWR